MIIVPKPPESRVTTSPPAATASTAAWNPRQGAASEQGFESLPKLATEVRCDNAKASGANNTSSASVAEAKPFVLVCITVSRFEPPDGS